jgi:hypothetical protein
VGFLSTGEGSKLEYRYHESKKIPIPNLVGNLLISQELANIRAIISSSRLRFRTMAGRIKNAPYGGILCFHKARRSYSCALLAKSTPMLVNPGTAAGMYDVKHLKL